MPSLRKLPISPSDLILGSGRDLTVFSVPTSQDMEAIMENTSVIQNPNICVLIGKENDYILPSSSPPPRKRQRLDHLSQEEKIMRRKLKNRVAAQSARDRKKAKMTELEEQVSLLERESKLLQIENKQLRERNAELELQNSQLRLRLTNQTPDIKAITAEGSSKDLVCEESEVSKEGGSLEYAEGTGSDATYSLDDAIRLLAGDNETDDLLGVLQLCSEQLLQCDLIADELESTENVPVEPSNEQVVGSSSKGLESIKELIQFDHIYHKRTEADSSMEVPESEACGFLSKASSSSAPSSSSSVTETDCSSNISIDSISGVVPTADISDVQIVVTSSDEEANEVVACSYIPAVSTLQSYGQLTVSTSHDRSPSPASSDTGYDSSFSVMSPGSDVYSTSAASLSDDDPWDNTLTELFPSLV